MVEGGGGPGLTGRQWYGMIIPAQPSPNNVVCVHGRPNNPAVCPKGTTGPKYYGRLWTAPGAASPGGPPLQVVCTPEKDRDEVCESPELVGKFAFLCLAQTNSNGEPVASPCPGVPRRR